MARHGGVAGRPLAQLEPAPSIAAPGGHGSRRPQTAASGRQRSRPCDDDTTGAPAPHVADHTTHNADCCNGEPHFAPGSPARPFAATRSPFLLDPIVTSAHRRSPSRRGARPKSSPTARRHAATLERSAPVGAAGESLLLLHRVRGRDYVVRVDVVSGAGGSGAVRFVANRVADLATVGGDNLPPLRAAAPASLLRCEVPLSDLAPVAASRLLGEANGDGRRSGGRGSHGRVGRQRRLQLLTSLVARLEVQAGDDGAEESLHLALDQPSHRPVAAAAAPALDLPRAPEGDETAHHPASPAAATGAGHRARSAPHTRSPKADTSEPRPAHNSAWPADGRPQGLRPRATSGDAQLPLSSSGTPPRAAAPVPEPRPAQHDPSPHHHRRPAPRQVSRAQQQLRTRQARADARLAQPRYATERSAVGQAAETRAADRRPKFARSATGRPRGGGVGEFGGEADAGDGRALGASLAAHLSSSQRQALIASASLSHLRPLRHAPRSPSDAREQCLLRGVPVPAPVPAGAPPGRAASGLLARPTTATRGRSGRRDMEHRQVPCPSAGAAAAVGGDDGCVPVLLRDDPGAPPARSTAASPQCGSSPTGRGAASASGHRVQCARDLRVAAMWGEDVESQASGAAAASSAHAVGDQGLTSGAASDTTSAAATRGEDAAGGQGLASGDAVVIAVGDQAPVASDQTLTTATSGENTVGNNGAALRAAAPSCEHATTDTRGSGDHGLVSGVAGPSGSEPGRAGQSLAPEGAALSSAGLSTASPGDEAALATRRAPPARRSEETAAPVASELPTRLVDAGALADASPGSSTGRAHGDVAPEDSSRGTPQ